MSAIAIVLVAAENKVGSTLSVELHDGIQRCYVDGVEVSDEIFDRVVRVWAATNDQNSGFIYGDKS